MRVNMSKNKMTIVVPFYNTDEKLASDFFASLKHQTSQEFDLIIIDDGSSEEKRQFLEQCATDFTDIEIVYNNHGGVSHSRNTGILKTCTDYLAFADSDDILDKEFVKTTVEYINQYKPDIIYGTTEYRFSPVKIRQSNGYVQYFENDEIDEAKKSLLDINPRRNSYRILGGPCAKIIKTELARRCLFDENVSIYEDQLFNRMIINEAKSVLVVPDIWYYYVQHQDSSLHRSFSKDFFNSLEPYLSKSFELDKNEDDAIKNQLRMTYIKILYGSINKDFIEKNICYSAAKKDLLTRLNNSAVKEAIEKIRLDKQVSFIDRFNIVLLRKQIIFPIYIQKRILFLFKGLFDKSDYK